MNKSIDKCIDINFLDRSYLKKDTLNKVENQILLIDSIWFCSFIIRMSLKHF